MPDPTNADRAKWAEDALNVFAETTYCGRTFTSTVRQQPNVGDDAYTMIVDLICNLQHLAAKHGWDAADVVASAVDHYEIEIAEAEAR